MCLWLSLFNSLCKAFAVWVNFPLFIPTSHIFKKNPLSLTISFSYCHVSIPQLLFREKKKPLKLSTHVVSSLPPCSSLTSLQPCISLRNFTSSPYVIHKVIIMLLDVIGPALIPGSPDFPGAFGTSATPLSWHHLGHWLSSVSWPPAHLSWLPIAILQ